MANVDLSVYGITEPAEVFYNPSYDLLYKHETDQNLIGFERGQITKLGAINVDTGIFTGRSPKD
nr:phosphoenolpyruvate carboxykinase (ATP) [Tenuifilaceae bacterium]